MKVYIFKFSSFLPKKILSGLRLILKSLLNPQKSFKIINTLKKKWKTELLLF